MIEAIVQKCRICKVEKPMGDFHRHAKNKTGISTRCKPCSKIAGKSWREANKIRVKEWRLDNAEKRSRQTKEYRESNIEKASNYSKAYYLENKERINVRRSADYYVNKERENSLSKKWARENRGITNALAAKRRGNELNATPPWVNYFLIEEIYDLAHRRSAATGVKWHVDHIVPIQGKIVCGLHVEHNLRVIPAIHNYRKSNKWNIEEGGNK